jgi:lipopolysaccharide/colanic/teichoic acid biosynthesis glycosyltransferase
MVKRLFDVVAAGIVLILLLPLYVIIAVIVRFESPGPALFTQPRLGRGGRPFVIYKFRTMTWNAASIGPSITIGSDPRITRIGRILRRYELDELPTLWNVLRGDMSIVGPRPELPKYLPYYGETERRVLDVRPGMTDPATLAFRREAALLTGDDAEPTYVRCILPRKLSLNLEYVRRQGVLYDFGIIIRTLATIIGQPK